MNVDTSLQTSAGLIKKIHKYTYTGEVEKLAKGAKNAKKGTVGLVAKDYTVERYQQTFEYNDMDVMADPMVVDVLSDGAAKTMANEIRTEYFAELENISNTYSENGVLTYDTIVDAVASLNDVEQDTTDLFVVMGNDARAAIRKDDEFKASKQGEILYTGQFGTVAGIPVVFSKLVPEGKCYITEKDAVTFFVKREGSVEQDRDIETKDNTVVYERHGVMALVDDTHSVIVNFGAAE
jgi:hypothetical protein